MNLNLVVIEGNLCADPEVTYTQGGTAVCEVNLACNEKIKKGEEWVEKTVFTQVKMFGRTAEIAGEYLSKGSRVTFQGKLAYDQWTDKESGKNRSKLYVIADKMIMPPRAKGGGDGSEYDQSNEGQQRRRPQGGGQQRRGTGGGQQRGGGGAPPPDDSEYSGGNRQPAGEEDIPF